MGGKTFTDKQTGINPATRIPHDHIIPLGKMVTETFSPFFKKLEMVSQANQLIDKPDNGDIDFVALKRDNTLDTLYKYLEENGFRRKTNGNMVHILYPFDVDGELVYYQVDFIMTSDYRSYKINLLYYSNPVVFNATVGHYARSIGYKFSTKGLLIHITDRRKQNYYYKLSQHLDEMLKLLCLEMPEDFTEIYESPKAFATWLMSSPRYDHRLMKLAENKKAHRDAKQDEFCGKVYAILEESKKTSEIPSSRIDFSQGEVDFANMLKHERAIVGDEKIDGIVEFCKKREEVQKPVISGDLLIDLGFKPGPNFRIILDDVAKVFNEDSDENEVRSYIMEKYSFEGKLH